MTQKHRIYTDIGKDQRINVEIKQEYELLEILSLKFTQQDVYSSANCSDYGVVVGRLSVNNGFGVPNARISIFIPLDDVDENDPVISTLYPYKTISDKDDSNYRYNLLPSRKQHGGHEPTGTFFDQEDIITREEYLEVFEKYYKYTVKTNDAGDFMIWGVPVGSQTIHMDIDLSDMGCFSIRPDDLIRLGYGVDEFKTTYQFKSSEDLDSLPQIKSFNKTIDVYPFWGNEETCQIGITRTDFDLSDQGVRVEPKAMIIGGSFTDTGKNSINKNCLPSKHMGAKCTLATHGGKIETIRFTSHKDSKNRPILEPHELNEDIFDDGSFAFGVPMNLDYLYTNEFGEHEYTNDPNKGIPTAACYRFRFSIKDEGLERVRKRANYLIPNIREFYTDDETSDAESNKSYAWSLNYDDYPTGGQSLILNTNDGFFVPQDYFYRFQYGKVYTVSSFQSTSLHNGFLSSNRYLGVKEIVPPEEKDCLNSVVTMPTNFVTKNTGFNFTLLLSIVLTFIQYVFAIIKLTVYEFIGSLFKSLWKVFRSVGWLSYHFNQLADSCWDLALKIQSGGQFTLPLVIYDDCELCTTDDDSIISGYNPDDYCKMGEIRFNIISETSGVFLQIIQITEDQTPGTSNIVSGDSARECNDTTLSGCCGTYLMSSNPNYDVMNSMNMTIGGQPYPRFIVDIGSNSNSPINSNYFLISNSGNDGSFPIVRSGLYYGFRFSNDQMSSIFSIENASTYFSGNTNTEWGFMVDQEHPKVIVQSYSGTSVEEGCSMYDTLYDEKIIKEILWFNGATSYGSPYEPINSGTNYSIGVPLNNDISPGIVELPVVDPSNLKANRPGPDWSIGASVFFKGGQRRLPRYMYFNWIGGKTYNRKTKTGFSEFRDGVFTIVPSIDGISPVNARAIREWYRRQLVGINFCGGVANYSFVDNWLSGALYFFHFKAKVKGSRVKACEENVKFALTTKTSMSNGEVGRFYYKSCPYKSIDSVNGIWGLTDANSNIKILHPTTFVDLGPRDEFIKEICTDPSLDPNCSVSRSIGTTSFKSFGELVAFAINYRMDVSNDAMKTSDFFTNAGFSTKFGGVSVFDGDIMQLISINSETGIEGFDLQNPKYLGYSISSLDPEDNKNVFQNGSGIYGPVPVTLQYETDGVRIRQCLNTPGYLTESSQRVPFYLWDKKGMGFGPNDPLLKDDQAWDYSRVQVDRLQGMTYNYRYIGAMSNGVNKDAYLLPPISYDFTGQTIMYADPQLAEEFDKVILITDPTYISDAHQLNLFADMYHGFTLLIAYSGTDIDPTSGMLYIRQGDAGSWTSGINWDPTLDYSIYPTVDPYTDTKQILSTPFMFYFGLRPGKTGLDKFIERFGPKGAFPSTD